MSQIAGSFTMQKTCFFVLPLPSQLLRHCFYYVGTTSLRELLVFLVTICKGSMMLKMCTFIGNCLS